MFKVNSQLIVAVSPAAGNGVARELLPCLIKESFEKKKKSSLNIILLFLLNFTKREKHFRLFIFDQSKSSIIIHATPTPIIRFYKY